MKTLLYCSIITLLFTNFIYKPTAFSLENKSKKTLFDTIYTNKKYKISLNKLNDLEFDTHPNTILKISKNQKIIFEDSIYNNYPENILFEDFNGDLIDDILIHYSSSARSNESFTLFLVDTLNDSFTRIIGFEQIPNPNYIAKYDIISNYVLSGKNWTGFYKIQRDTVFEFNISIQDDMTEESTYDEEYKKAIKKIKHRNKKENKALKKNQRSN